MPCDLISEAKPGSYILLVLRGRMQELSYVHKIIVVVAILLSPHEGRRNNGLLTVHHRNWDTMLFYWYRNVK
jgi:hypothetical protein